MYTSFHAPTENTPFASGTYLRPHDTIFRFHTGSRPCLKLAFTFMERKTFSGNFEISMQMFSKYEVCILDILSLNTKKDILDNIVSWKGEGQNLNICKDQIKFSY